MEPNFVVETIMQCRKLVHKKVKQKLQKRSLFVIKRIAVTFLSWRVSASESLSTRQRCRLAAPRTHLKEAMPFLTDRPTNLTRAQTHCLWLLVTRQLIEYTRFIHEIQRKIASQYEPTNPTFHTTIFPDSTLTSTNPYLCLKTAT